MKYMIMAAICVILNIALFVAGMISKVIGSSAVYMDDSFRWGGRDG